MDKVGRFVGDKIDVDDKSVHDFFDQRTNKKLFHRYNLVNYQDNTPELALERDRIEKEKILPMLNVSDDSRIIDIGCGVGRWGDAFAPILKDGLYLGVDYSDKLINVANAELSKAVNQSTRRFCVESFQNLWSLFEEKGLEKFDIVIINGVLMYINDYDIPLCFENVQKIIANGGRIYLKESVGVRERYTLNNIFSEELGSQYSAIYRSIEEYDDLLHQYFGKYIEISRGETFGAENLHNRKETTSYYWIISQADE